MTDLIDCLHLNIISCSCVCGNRWTHSHPWLASKTHGYLGGTPNPTQMEKLRFESYSSHLWNVNGCHRCVPLQLSEGWTKPLLSPRFDGRSQEKAKREQEARSVEDDLLA